MTKVPLCKIALLGVTENGRPQTEIPDLEKQVQDGLKKLSEQTKEIIANIHTYVGDNWIKMHCN